MIESLKQEHNTLIKEEENKYNESLEKVKQDHKTESNVSISNYYNKQTPPH
jgi:hypothetical protein